MFMQTLTQDKNFTDNFLLMSAGNDITKISPRENFRLYGTVLIPIEQN